jgi:DNA-binding NarL/FixJ family response regulator
MGRRRVFIVEDHEDMRTVLIDFLGLAVGVDVCGTASTAEEAIVSLRDLGADLAVVDVSLPGMSGIDLVQQLRGSHPGLACLMLSGHGEIRYVQRALDAGARGYVLKGDARELPHAIDDILAGGIYLSEPVRQRVSASFPEPLPDG